MGQYLHTVKQEVVRLSRCMEKIYLMKDKWVLYLGHVGKSLIILEIKILRLNTQLEFKCLKFTKSL
jgi:hypothetical protein